MEFCYLNNPNSLFRKYARLVTWFAGTGIGRDYLGVPKGIGLMLPNGYIQGNGAGARATFYPLVEYSPKLSLALTKIDLVSQWLKDFKETKHLFAWELGLTREIPALATSVMFASATKYPDADPETTSVDGAVEIDSTDDTWATYRDGATANHADASGANYILARTTAGASSSTWTAMNRGIFLFDTSSLSGTVTAATFSLYGLSSNYSDSMVQDICLVSSAPASNTAIVNGDYDSLGTTQFASDIDLTSYSQNSYNDWTLNASGLAAVDVDGISKFGVRLSGDRTDTEPSWGSGLRAEIYCYYADQTGTANDPKLVITYTPDPPLPDKWHPKTNQPYLKKSKTVAY